MPCSQWYVLCGFELSSGRWVWTLFYSGLYLCIVLQVTRWLWKSSRSSGPSVHYVGLVRCYRQRPGFTWYCYITVALFSCLGDIVVSANGGASGLSAVARKNGCLEIIFCIGKPSKIVFFNLWKVKNLERYFTSPVNLCTAGTSWSSHVQWMPLRLIWIWTSFCWFWSVLLNNSLALLWLKFFFAQKSCSLITPQSKTLLILALSLGGRG